MGVDGLPWWPWIAAMATSPSTALVAAIAVRKEWRNAAYYATALFLIQAGLAASWCNETRLRSWGRLPGEQFFRPFMSVCIGIGVVCLLITAALLVRCVSNFNNGLEVYLERNSKSETRWTAGRFRKYRSYEALQEQLLPQHADLA